MLEGRRARIIMPWGEASLDILIESKSLACDLLDTVASKCKLVERFYFGLAYRDLNTSHLNWLQPDKRVLDYDLPKSNGFLILHFAVRYYVDTYAKLQTTTAIELMYLQSKELIFKGDLECSDDNLFKLAALVLQETSGDYTDDESTKKLISKYSLLPAFVLKKHLSIQFCENRILQHYKSLARNTRGLLIVGFLSIVESLPSYGTHYYRVKDKDGMPWWLGMNRKGIAVFDSNDRTRPRKLFEWETIENIFYRDKKFCLEVHSSRRSSNKVDGCNLYDNAVRDSCAVADDLSLAISDPTTQVSISKRVYGPSTVDVHQWICQTPHVTEVVWFMAVSQHKFSVEMSLRASVDLRSHEEIVRELNNSFPIFSEPGWTDHSQSATDLALETKKILSSSGSDADILEKAKLQLKVLNEKKHVLSGNLSSKMLELKRLCLDEANLIGKLPREYPLQEGEVVPRVKKRVGTAYSLCPEMINTSSESGGLSQLVLDYEIQDKITKAALVLAQEDKIQKSMRKSRIETYHREWMKLKSMESQLKQLSKVVKRSTDDSGKLRSMAEPSKVHSLTSSDVGSHRSLEALSYAPQPLYQPKHHAFHNRPDHFRSDTCVLTSRGHRSKTHKSAPSSPTLLRNSDCNQRHEFRSQKQSSSFDCSDAESNVAERRVSHRGYREASSAFPAHHDAPHQRKFEKQQHIVVRPQHWPPQDFAFRSHNPSLCRPASHSTSFVIPLSADPRITSRNFAVGYGLLNCGGAAVLPGLLRRKCSELCVPTSHCYVSHERYFSQELPFDRAMERNFSRMHLSDDAVRRNSGSSSTLSSSSGGASGSASSCNQIFSKSNAYPVPSQMASTHHFSRENVLSDSSTSTSMSCTFDSSAAASKTFVHRAWDPSEETLRNGFEFCDGGLQRGARSRDSGYEASSQGMPYTPPPSRFSANHSHPLNPRPNQTPFKMGICKPYEMSDFYKYSKSRHPVLPGLQCIRSDRLPSCSHSSSSAGSLSPGSLSSLFSARPSPIMRTNGTNVWSCSDTKESTLTRDNADECREDEAAGGSMDGEQFFAGNSTLLSNSSSRCRRPILCDLEIPGEMLEGSFSGMSSMGNPIQRMSDSSETGSNRDVSFASFRLEPKVSQEFEAEMLEWYDLCGISPQPDDKFTLV